MPEFRFGARLLSTGRTHFRFWAPSLAEVALEIEGRASRVMTPHPDGWFDCEVDCGAGSRYRFRVMPELAVPDPASHLQAGDVHDASVVVDHDNYQWQHAAWAGRPWHETVLYELHVGACGGFAGVAARLPALAALGVTAVELMPIADFPGAHNWGYDGVLMYAPDASYGTPDELKAMIDAAHGLGMMMFLDVVYNHFGPDGNYFGAYAKPLFRDDLPTPWGKAIDFRVPEVRDFFTGNALHWLHTYRFDGLRFDAVHAIAGHDWLCEVAQVVRASTPPGRHIHLVVENDDNDATLLTGVQDGLFDAQWNDDMHHAFHVLLTGEQEGYYAAYAERPAEKFARGLSEGFIFQGEASLHRGGVLRGTPSAHLPPTAFINFLQNHDQTGNRAFGERLTALANPQALATAQAVLLMTPAIPLLFMGEETGAREPFLYFTDHADPVLAEAVRNGRRTEFARFAAFADPALRDRIPDPNAAGTYVQCRPMQASDAVVDPSSEAARVSAWYARLLALRKAHVVPGIDGARSLSADAIGTAAVCACWKLGNGRVLTVAVNFATEDLALDCAAANVQTEKKDEMTAAMTPTGTSDTTKSTASITTGIATGIATMIATGSIRHGTTASLMPGPGALVLIETGGAVEGVATGTLPARSMLAFLEAS